MSQLKQRVSQELTSFQNSYTRFVIYEFKNKSTALSEYPLKTTYISNKANSKYFMHCSTFVIFIVSKQHHLLRLQKHD